MIVLEVITYPQIYLLHLEILSIRISWLKIILDIANFIGILKARCDHTVTTR